MIEWSFQEFSQSFHSNKLGIDYGLGEFYFGVINGREQLDQNWDHRQWMTNKSDLKSGTVDDP